MKRSLYLLVFLLMLWPQMARAQCPVGAWANPTTPPPISDWTDIAYGGGRYVVISSGSDGGTARAAYSTDGMVWQQASTSIPSNEWRTVTYGNGRFVAVGWVGSRRVMTSTNGNTWTMVNSTTTNSAALQSVVFGNGRFVAVGNSGSNRIVTSENGTTWEARTAPINGSWSTVGYGGGRFVVLSFSGTNALYSDDGINWQQTTAPSGSWMDIVYGGGQFVAVSWTGTHIATSPDGITWTPRAVSDSRNWNTVTYAGGHYLAFAGGGSGPNRMMVSADGIVWDPQPIPHNGMTLGFSIWADDRLVVGGHDMYTGAIQVFVGACPFQCYMPTAPIGAREWFDTEKKYKFCTGDNGWIPFSLDGEAGSCSAEGQMEWHATQSSHTMCDGAARHVLRYAEQSCSLTDQMLSVGNSISNPAWVDEAGPIALYDNGTKAVVGARWNTAQMRFDLSAEPAAPTVIGSPTMATGRVDINDLIVRNNHVFSISPSMNGAGRIFASPLSNMATSYSYPTSGAVAGNRMCHALGFAMNDAGTVGFATAWDSGAATCDWGGSGSCILNVFNTSNPASMSEITSVNLSTLATNSNVYCNEAYFRDNKLFVSFASGPGNGGLMVLNVSNPAAPTLLGQRWVTGIGNTQFDFFDVSADGNLAIMVSRTGRVVSMDVSNPANPVVLSSALNLPTTGGASDVVIVKNYAFIAMKPNHIYAVNIADPSNLTLDATITDNIFSNIGQLVLSGEYIYYTSTGSGRVGMLGLNCDVENSGPPDLGICSTTAEIEFEPSVPLYKYCDGSNWRPMTGDPCGEDKNPQPGTLCFDGTYYVGAHPTLSGVRLFTTANDVGAISQWSNEAVRTGAISFVDGLANQRLIKNTRSIANYPALQACDNLNVGGHNDWYLPSLAELDMLYSYLAVQTLADPDNPTPPYAGSGTGGSNPSTFAGPMASSFTTNSDGWYWASTEANAGFSYDMSFNSGYKDFYGNKTDTDNYNRVRCVRRTGKATENLEFYAASYAFPSETIVRRTSTIQNVTDGPRFTLSMWFKLDEVASNPSYTVLFENHMGRVQVVLASASPSAQTYQVYMQGKSDSDVTHGWVDTTHVVEEGKWYHLIATMDTSLGVGRIYLNDVEMTYGNRNVASGGQNLDIQTTNYFIPIYGGTNFFKGQVGEVWFDNVFIDLGVTANRRNFISADGRPVNLGANGSAPTGSQPLLFFTGEPHQWATNKGRGGAFSTVNTLRYYPLDP